MSAKPGDIICWVCLLAGSDTPEDIIPSSAVAVTIYDGKAYCVPHFHERRRAVTRSITNAP